MTEFVFDTFKHFSTDSSSKGAIIGVEHLPCDYQKLENQNYENFFKKNGCIYFFEFNSVFLNYSNDKEIYEIRIIDDKDFIEFTDEGEIFSFSKNNKYENIDKKLKTEFPEKIFVHHEKKIDEFKIKNNKLVIIDILKPVFFDEDTIDIDEDSRVYECANGTYEVYSLLIEHQNNFKKKYSESPPPYGYAIRLKS